MPLKLEVCLIIVFIVLFTFLTGIVTTVSGIEKTFIIQLNVKNVDNANILAANLSRLEKDLSLQEIFITAQFDLGHFQRIELKDVDGETIFKRSFDEEIDKDVPTWFKDYYPLQAPFAAAEVIDGWNAYGVLEVESDTSGYRKELWNLAERIFWSYMFIGLISTLIGVIFVNALLIPLNNMVKQANAFINKQFIKIKTPFTTEFQKIVHATNTLADRMRMSLEEENRRLDALKYESSHDLSTGISNRKQAFSALSSQLAFRDTEGQNIVFMLHFGKFGLIAANQGEKKAEELMREFTRELTKVVDGLRDQRSDAFIGRIRDYRIMGMMVETFDIHIVQKHLQELAIRFTEQHKDEGLAICGAVQYLFSTDTVTGIVNKLDIILTPLIDENRAGVACEDTREKPALFESEADWQRCLNDAIREDQVSFFDAPLFNLECNTLIHYQSWLGLRLNGVDYRAGSFIHWARKLNLMEKIEFIAIKKLCARIKGSDFKYDYSLLLSDRFLTNQYCLAKLDEFASLHTKSICKLNIEFRESTVIEHANAFGDFCKRYKPLGIKIGLRKVGDKFSLINGLQEYGLDYLKLDTLFTHDITTNPTNQLFLRGFCSLAHSMNIRVYADGVIGDEATAVLKNIGVDGLNRPDLIY
ncbi:EAL domain-containing protein [Aestuariibacter sp. AA17]|uniref:EAL domain-containing protein n=1 Tax=Fluctibacter corallii TaxID=2984329 RepID=A0ABT3A882_9ALTE|nr:EAL domain-containing protein [Aestuariibacter sp. AA17]MCV2884536.1 EAL domain-containing protein [Aestuariibacter sp. AA17]